MPCSTHKPLSRPRSFGTSYFCGRAIPNEAPPTFACERCGRRGWEITCPECALGVLERNRASSALCAVLGPARVAEMEAEIDMLRGMLGM